MADWREDNFLEKLMPATKPERSRCPNADAVCAFAENRVANPEREALASHIMQCPRCGELYLRLVQFAQPAEMLPESEWAIAEKSLSIWFNGLVRSPQRARFESAPLRYTVAGPRAHEVENPPSVYELPDPPKLQQPKVSWFSLIGAQWALAGAVLALVIFGAGGGAYYWAHVSRTNVGPASATSSGPTEAYNPPPITNLAPAPTQEQPAQPEPTKHPTPAAQIPSNAQAPLQVPNATKAPNPTLAQSTPPNASQPVRPPPPNSQAPPETSPPARAAAIPRGAAESQNQVAQAPPPAPRAPNAENATVTPEAKEAIAEEVKTDLQAEQMESASANEFDSNQVPAALDPRRTTFIASATVSGQTDDGQGCSLTGGDIITRLTNTPDQNQNVRVLITTAKTSDCAVGTQVAMSIEDLQDMYNAFREKLDGGLAELAKDQGTRGMPKAQETKSHVNPDSRGEVDPTATADLQEQQIDADNAEDDVQQATEGVVASAFRTQRRSSGGPRLELISWPQIAQNSKPSAPPPKNAPAAPKPSPSQTRNASPTQSNGSAPAANAPAARPATAEHPGAISRPGRPPTASNNANRPATTEKPGISSRNSLVGRSSSSSRAKFHAPAGSTARLDSRGTTYTARNGASFHTTRAGTLDSLKTRNGTEAKFSSNGKAIFIHTKSGANITRGANGSRQVETIRRDGTRVVSTGRGRGYSERIVERGGRHYISRTYLGYGRPYARMYRAYYYHGAYFAGYFPGYWYGPRFYGWAYNPWAAPIAWGWGWYGAPWYGFYGGYFAPYAYYPGPAFWLTDYIIAANLQAAYDAQAAANSFMKPDPDPRVLPRAVPAVAVRPVTISAAVSRG
jgi:hypothetical protein